MGKHASKIDKIVFLVHIEYVSQAEAARKVKLPKQTASDIKKLAKQRKELHNDLGIAPPTYQQQVARIKGSGAKPKIIEDEITRLFEACTLNKKQRKKLWHVVAYEEGFFDLHRRTIEKKLRERGLRRRKSTKKLSLTDIHKSQRYKVALSRKDWGLEEWRRVIFSDEASIIVSTKRRQQNISRTVSEDERYHTNCIERRYNNYSEAMF
jgi:hypothetical protein